MNSIKKALTVASATVLCALPFTPAVSNNVEFFKNNTLTVSAANYDTYFQQYPDPTHANGYYNPYCYSEEVKWIQSAINYINEDMRLGIGMLDVDGYYGSNTIRAVKVIQNLIYFDGYTGAIIIGRITVDGYAGTNTVNKINRLIDEIIKKHNNIYR